MVQCTTDEILLARRISILSFIIFHPPVILNIAPMIIQLDAFYSGNFLLMMISDVYLKYSEIAAFEILVIL